MCDITFLVLMFYLGFIYYGFQVGIGAEIFLLAVFDQNCVLWT